MASSESVSRPSIVYKILLQSQWQSWTSKPRTPLPGSERTAHLFTGAGIDVQDGCIHLSTAEQSAGTYEKWFAPNNPAEDHSDSNDQAKDKTGEALVLVEIDLTKVVGRVEWEFAKSRGDAFAHVYDGGIPYVPKGDANEEVSAVLRAWEGSQVKKSLFKDILENRS